MRVKPAEGRTIRDPQTMRVIPDDGTFEVPDHDLWWSQRLNEGDVVRFEEPPPEADEVEHTTDKPLVVAGDEPAVHEESER